MRLSARPPAHGAGFPPACRRRRAGETENSAPAAPRCPGARPPGGPAGQVGCVGVRRGLEFGGQDGVQGIAQKAVLIRSGKWNAGVVESYRFADFQQRIGLQAGRSQAGGRL